MSIYYVSDQHHRLASFQRLHQHGGTAAWPTAPVGPKARGHHMYPNSRPSSASCRQQWPNLSPCNWVRIPRHLPTSLLCPLSSRAFMGLVTSPHPTSSAVFSYHRATVPAILYTRPDLFLSFQQTALFSESTPLIFLTFISIEFNASGSTILTEL